MIAAYGSPTHAGGLASTAMRSLRGRVPAPYSQRFAGASRATHFVTAAPPMSLEGIMASRLASSIAAHCDIFACFVALPLASSRTSQSVAENFRIETKVFEGKSEEPTQRNDNDFLRRRGLRFSEIAGANGHLQQAQRQERGPIYSAQRRASNPHRDFDEQARRRHGRTCELGPANNRTSS